MRSQKEIWQFNQALEWIERVRRCTFCGAREDKHNLPADMEYYKYEAHEFVYPSQEEIASYSKLESSTDEGILQIEETNKHKERQSTGIL